MSDQEGGPARPDAQFRLALSAHAPGAARDQAGTWLDSIGVHPDLRRDVLIAVSELVTNAVTHAASAPRVHLMVLDGHVRLEVHDASAARPVRKTGSASGGFGIRLIAELSESWGWSPTDGGKVVWAEFDADRTRSALSDAADGGQ